MKKIFPKTPPCDFHVEPKPYLSYIPLLLQSYVKEILRFHWEKSLGHSTMPPMHMPVKWGITYFKIKTYFPSAKTKSVLIISTMHLKK